MYILFFTLSIFISCSFGRISFVGSYCLNCLVFFRYFYFVVFIHFLLLLFGCCLFCFFVVFLFIIFCLIQIIWLLIGSFYYFSYFQLYIQNYVIFHFLFSNYSSFFLFDYLVLFFIVSKLLFSTQNCHENKFLCGCNIQFYGGSKQTEVCYKGRSQDIGFSSQCQMAG